MSFSFPTPELGFMTYPKGPYCLPLASFPNHVSSAFVPDFLGASGEMSSQLLPALGQHTS